VPDGYVISQQPEAGMPVKEGRVINLMVSKGGEVVAVPQLSGFTRANAEVQITNALLTLGKVEEQYSPEIKKRFCYQPKPLGVNPSRQGKHC